MAEKKVQKKTSPNHSHGNSCHVDLNVESKFPSHAKEKQRLNRIKGQLDGVERMIDEKRYCMEIIFQLRAAASALKALEKEIMHTHIKSCVKKAIESDDQLEAQEKIQEIMNFF